VPFESVLFRVWRRDSWCSGQRTSKPVEGCSYYGYTRSLNENTPTHRPWNPVFFGAYRRQVLGLLLLHPDESFHLREIARATNTQPGTLRRELTQLADAGVLSREKVGNLVRYKADSTCPIYDELRGILKKTAGVADVLREALAPLNDRFRWPSCMVRSRAVPSGRVSDIDVMVVGRASFEEVVARCTPARNDFAGRSTDCL